MRTLSSIATCAALLVWGIAARADEKAVCLEAASQAQTQRDAHQLIEARDALRTCARASCPSVVQRDCAMWLDEVEKMVPTVVFSVRDADGADVFDVRVHEGDKLLAPTLDGTAIAMNPGPHTFRFELKDGRSIEQRVMVSEAQKDLRVQATLPKPTQGASSKAAQADAASGSSSTPAASDSGVVAAGQPNRTWAYVSGGVGVVGLAVGGVTGFLAMQKKKTVDSDCTGSVCTTVAGYDAANSGKKLGNVSTVAFGIGIVGIAVGTVLWIAAPRQAESAAVDIRGWRADVGALPSGGLTLTAGRAW